MAWLIFVSSRPVINPILMTTALIAAVRLAAAGTSHILSSSVSLPLIWPGPLVPDVTDSCLTWGPEKIAFRETRNGGLGAKVAHRSSESNLEEEEVWRWEGPWEVSSSHVLTKCHFVC